MNSKEALKRLIGNKVFILLAREQGKKQFVNDINIIKKDLEVLEILKRMLTVEKGSTWYFLDTKHPFFEKQEDIDKVKEWLESE